ncbi:MAG: 4-hydroxy-3-methylbut-2-enyl diphosphate reductase [Chitinivibrionales bacterium]|nr:4-hydroxy-3-methylbut-2-enyl diphosphate reductase [Chitinivibrionales bacterium]
MKVIIAETAGFCMGVKRAVDLAIDHSRKENETVYTYGPLIHNRQTVEMLNSRGVTELDNDSPLKKAPIIIRAHGIPLHSETKLRSKGHEIIDGTCPKVKTVHRVITKYRKLGYTIIITGDEGHAEVIGLMGYAGDRGLLVQSPSDIDSIPPTEKVCLVSQTTFDRELFDDIAARARTRFKEQQVVVKKTICSATKRRQTETKEIASMVDAMIVVGGKNSANTQRLAKISSACNTPTQHVESEKELDIDALEHCNTVGITAGASTPQWMIKRVVDYLQFMSHRKKKTLKDRVKRVLDLCAIFNIFIAAGATAAYYASCTIQRIDLPLQEFALGGVVVFFYFLSIYLVNSMTSIEITQHLGISRYQFYQSHKTMILLIAEISIALLLAASLTINLSLFYLMLFSTTLGALYHITIVPLPLRRIFKYSNLKDVPTSRDLFVALAWAILATFIPHAIRNQLVFTKSTVFVFGWIFVLAFLRSLMADLRDIEGDRIMGRETLVTIMGEKRVKKGIHRMIWACLIITVCYSAIMAITDFGKYSHGDISLLFQLPAIVYMMVFVRWHEKNHRTRSTLFNILSEAPFYIAAIGAWVTWRIN